MRVQSQCSLGSTRVGNCRENTPVPFFRYENSDDRRGSARRIRGRHGERRRTGHADHGTSEPRRPDRPQSRARARGVARLRTCAAHARWEEIGLGDVASVIELTKELVAAHLG